MGALPRPATPGPWTYDKGIGTVVIPGGGEPSDADMEAVAALPERIAREDRVRALCKGAILARPPGAMSPADAIRTIKWDAEALMAQRVLALLDGEEGA